MPFTGENVNKRSGEKLASADTITAPGIIFSLAATRLVLIPPGEKGGCG
jgi:hypothetical protein